MLEEVKIPHLIHADLWPGNILLAKAEGTYKVAAIIDADRSIFGDVDFDHAMPWIVNETFLEGYGINKQAFYSESRKCRRQIYCLIYHIIDAYAGIVEYNNAAQYEEHIHNIEETLENL